MTHSVKIVAFDGFFGVNVEKPVINKIMSQHISCRGMQAIYTPQNGGFEGTLNFWTGKGRFWSMCVVHGMIRPKLRYLSKK